MGNSYFPLIVWILKPYSYKQKCVECVVKAVPSSFLLDCLCFSESVCLATGCSTRSRWRWTARSTVWRTSRVPSTSATVWTTTSRPTPATSTGTRTTKPTSWREFPASPAGFSTVSKQSECSEGNSQPHQRGFLWWVNKANIVKGIPSLTSGVFYGE